MFNRDHQVDESELSKTVFRFAHKTTFGFLTKAKIDFIEY